MIAHSDMKIILIGPPGIGKTTIKKMFFEKANPIEILCNKLEPTIGVEITSYNLNKNVILHDLAGQELNRWLIEEPEIFFETDLIICMLDARDSWNNNTNFISQITQISNNYCVNAELVFFFHKIDLLTKSENDLLSSRVLDFELEFNKGRLFLTSLAPNYYYSTFKSFIFIMQLFVDNNEILKFNEIALKMEIINLLQNNKEMKLEILFDKLKVPILSFSKIIGDIISDGFIEKDKKLKIFRLTEKGLSIIIDYKKGIINGNVEYLPPYFFFE